VAEALYQPFPLPGPARAHVWHHVPETRRPRHFHSEPELNLVAAGSATFGVGDLTISVGPGDLLWWAPGQDHVLVDASIDFDLYVVGLTPEFSERVLGSGTASAHGGATRTRLDPESLARLRSDCSAPLGGDPTAVEQHLGDLWREAHDRRRTALAKRASTSHALVSLIEKPELGRDDVALAVRAHPTDVSRHFHRDIGLTLTEYRTRLRLLRFIHSMDRGEANLLSAALNARFGSYSQYHRAFHGTLACSPRDFFRTDLRSRMKDLLSPRD